MRLPPPDGPLFDVPGPHLRLSMVMSVDGSATDEEGWTAHLGRSADKRLIRALRGVADAILVGAGSIRTGRYPPHRPTPSIRSARTRAGRAEFAPLVVVTSGGLDWSLPAFASAPTPTYVLTCASAGPMDLPASQVLVHGESRVDLAAGLADLRDRLGLRAILCEGGPGLAGALLEAGLVDELVLSLAPSLLPVHGHRLVAGLEHRVELDLTDVYEEDSQLVLRYRVR